MNPKQELAKKLAERSKWDTQVCDSLAERIAQTQRIRSIAEDAPETPSPKATDLRLGRNHER